MKRITFLTGRLSHSGGLEKTTRRLAAACVEKNCKVSILTTEPHDIEDVEVIPVTRRTKWTYRHLLQFDTYAQDWIRKHPQEVVFGMERNTFQTHYRAGSGVHAAFLKRRALTASSLKRSSFKWNPLHRTLLHMEKTAFESPSLKILFVNSSMVKEEILSHYSTPSEKIEVVYNGVEWKEMEEDFEHSLTKESAPFEFLFVGNGYHRKGLSFLLEGLSLLLEKDFHLSVVGKERMLPSFQHYARKLGLEKRVTFYGPQKDVRPFYKKADALVIPSLYDPSANVTCEALAMGLYVVSSKHNGGGEILTPQTGTLIEELTSKESVAEALKKALARPKTSASASAIRESVRHLDFSRQLDIIVSKTLASCTY